MTASTNVFDRVQLNALQDPWGYPLPAVNLSAGSPLDWWHAPTGFSAALATGFRKSGGGSQITVAYTGATTGFNDDIGQSFTWTDGTSGTGTTYSNITQGQTIGLGYTITAAVPRWPDWRTLRVWVFSANPHQVTYTASIAGDSDAVDQSTSIGPPNEENDDFLNNGTFLIDVQFASEVSGRTLTLTVARNAVSMGNLGVCAAALYLSGPTLFPARGATAGVVGSSQ